MVPGLVLSLWRCHIFIWVTLFPYCVRSLQNPPQFQLFIRKTQHTVVLTHGYDLLQQQDRKQYQRREKAQGAKSGGNQAQASKNPLPVESYGVCVIPPAVSCDSMCETLPTREACQKLSVRGLYRGLIPGSLSLAHTKIPDPRRKTSVHDSHRTNR